MPLHASAEASDHSHADRETMEFWVAEASDHSHVNREIWEFWLVAGLAVAGFVFGFWGLWKYESQYESLPHNASGFFNVLYHTLQLFVLHSSPELDNHVSWQLDCGRWLAAAAVLFVAARALFRVFGSEWRLLWIRLFRRDHVIVCGLGQVGMQLALEFRGQGTMVVAIEADGAPGQIATAHRAKIAVIRGDARNPVTMRCAALRSASKIIAVCDDDQKNVAIAAVAGELLQGRPADAPCIECWLFIVDPRLRQIFQRDRLFPHTGPNYQVNVRGLDLFELSARQVLRRHPLDYERISAGDPRDVHLVIVGFGSMGQNLALQAARIGHFANCGKKLHITAIEQDGGARAKAFLDHYPKFKEICEFTAVPVSPPADHLDPDSVVQVLPPQDEAKELRTIAVCWQSGKIGGDDVDFLKGLERDDPTNLSLALGLCNKSSRSVLVFQTRERGFGSLFPVMGRGQAIGQQIHPFGMHEEAWSLDALLHEREDGIAKALHKDYLDKQIAMGRKFGDRPALYPWEQLPERFKDSNRRAADHIRVKLRAIGYRVDDKARDDQPSLSSVPEQDLELLARMEHESWRAEWLLQGYSYAPGERNDTAKTSPYLVAWESLDKGVQTWDVDQVKAIPAALTAAKYWIYPQVT